MMTRLAVIGVVGLAGCHWLFPFVPGASDARGPADDRTTKPEVVGPVVDSRTAKPEVAAPVDGQCAKHDGGGTVLYPGSSMNRTGQWSQWNIGLCSDSAAASIFPTAWVDASKLPPDKYALETILTEKSAQGDQTDWPGAG